ncbi:MAG: hypothetical protein EBX41_08845, partial [Chitinophagia bacterium]|nr:hypothetical protein [Chitinophagia bacterium]
MKHIIIYLLPVLLLCNVLYAQTAERKKLPATRIKEKIVIDGKADEAAWANAQRATGFTNYNPNPGTPSIRNTEVRVLYDDNAVYVFADMLDNHPDSILKQLTTRDEFDYANTDAFGVNFDTYSDQQNGFAFVTTAAGVQADAKIIGSGFDFSWNAAWLSKARIHEYGWSVEMRIPYSAIRFPKIIEQHWRVNFFRNFRRTREKSYWSAILPGVANMLSQYGDLTGIDSIKAPIRLAFLPYLSAYTEDYDHNTVQTYNGGMDIKYGLSESFTLDMTLVPDFGQTLFDYKVLNLSPFEVRYDERRYFFTEGVELFNRGDLFYSRRVGGMPVNYGNATNSLKENEIVAKNPTSTKLANAIKVSGRTHAKTGIGIFNAISLPTYAQLLDTLTGETREVQTSPLTNYNVAVVEQILGKYSYIGVVNTNVTRKENSYNANVSKLYFRIAGKKNKYALTTDIDVSQKFIPNEKTDAGYRYEMYFSKVSGNYTAGIGASSISDRFNSNDLGYLGRKNFSSYTFYNNYNVFKPVWYFNSIYSGLLVSYNRSFAPDDYMSVDISGSCNFNLKTFASTGIYMGGTPGTSNDYFEPRKQGRLYRLPGSFYIGYYYSSDYRKKAALDVEIATVRFAEDGRYEFTRNISPRYRFSDKLLVVYSLNINTKHNDVGFVKNINDSIYLGHRLLHTVTNQLTASYIFTNRMSLKLNARHYWSQAEYNRYSLLLQDGNLSDDANYATNHNVNYNSF